MTDTDNTDEQTAGAQTGNQAAKDMRQTGEALTDSKPTGEATTDAKPAGETAKAAQSAKMNRLEALKKKQDQLKAQIAALEAREKLAERKRDTRRKIVVGGAVLAHAALHPAFAAELASVLRTAVTRDSDRDTIRDFLD